MATNRNFTNFRAVYDDLTGEVERSSEQFLPDHLENWFALIDETPEVQEIVRSLESGVFMEYIHWPRKYKGAIPTESDTEFKWPSGRATRLGMQLSMFRDVSKRTLAARVLGERGISATESEGAREIIKHVFSPMARDLRRLLEKDLLESPEAAAPAADRLVRLDHNSAPYNDAMVALEDLEKVLTEANDYPGDIEEKEERVAEVSASRRLFKAIWVRIEPVVVLLRPLVTQFATKLKDSLIGAAVGKVIGALAALLGQIF
jgi:hypothetical protein